MSFSFSKHSAIRPNSVPLSNYLTNRASRGADFWGPLLQRNATKLRHEANVFYPQYQHDPSTSTLNSTVKKAETYVRPDKFTRVKYADTNNNISSTVASNNEGSTKSSSKTSTKSTPGSSKSLPSTENEGRGNTGPYPSVKAVFSSPPPPRPKSASSSSPRTFTPPFSPQQQQQRQPLTLLPSKIAIKTGEPTRTKPTRRRTADPTATATAPRQFFSSDPFHDKVNNSAAAPPGPSSAEVKGNSNSISMKDAHIVLPRRGIKPPMYTRRNSSTSDATCQNCGTEVGTVTVNASPGGRRNGRKCEEGSPVRGNNRAQTPPQLQEQNDFTNNNSSTEMKTIHGCLKRLDSSKRVTSRANSESPISRPVRQGVTFAPGTLNVERENKPRKDTKMKNNRRPKFAHPCSGHFLPPLLEIKIVAVPDRTCTENPYSKFYAVWAGPMARVSKESVAKKAVRSKRFRTILSSLSIIHESFNSVTEDSKAHLMTQEILPRYISALDIALTDGEIDHIEQLLTTIMSSLKVLQMNLRDVFFDKNGHPRKIPPIEENYFVDVGPIIFAMNRIAGDHHSFSPSELPIESQMVKLQLELLVLCFCPFDCVIFRSQLSVLPGTARIALEKIRELKSARTYYCVRWINDSVMHRDYMSLLKFFGFCDTFGAKNPVPLPTRGRYRMENVVSNSSMMNECNTQICKSNTSFRRPVSADPVLMSNSVAHSHFNNSSQRYFR